MKAQHSISHYNLNIEQRYEIMNAGKILLVEDNDDDVALLQRALKKHGMFNEVIRARNGVQALEILFGTGDMPEQIPSLVFLDLKLPKLNGLDVLKAIRENAFTRGLPIIILTTSTEQEDIIESYNLGANSYIRKPVEFDRFLSAVGQLGLYWMTLNEINPKYHG
jgi:two-component system response regulator